MVKLPHGSAARSRARAIRSVALLRKRLKVGLPPATDKPADENVYDDTLKAAVIAFQTESGTRPDGIVGNATRALLNDVEELSPAKLLANMEEWRWMPEDLGDLYVTVNIPEFTLRVVKNGAVIHTERVITGQPTSRRRCSPTDEADRLPAALERAQLDQGAASSSRAWRAAAPRSAVRACACRAMAATSIPRASTGALPTSATSTSTSRRGRATCSAS